LRRASPPKPNYRSSGELWLHEIKHEGRRQGAAL
jgi:hypothetical protein